MHDGEVPEIQSLVYAAYHNQLNQPMLMTYAEVQLRLLTCIEELQHLTWMHQP